MISILCHGHGPEECASRGLTESLRNERSGSVSSHGENHHSDHFSNLMKHEGLSVESERDPFGPVEDDGFTDLEEGRRRSASLVDASTARRESGNLHPS